MNNDINITITRNGQYSFKDNLRYKVRSLVYHEMDIINDFFTRPL